MAAPQAPSELPAEKEKGDPKPFLVWLGLGFCVKCFAFSLLMIMLLLSLLFTGLDVPLGIQPFTLGKSLKLIYSAAIVPLLVLAGDILKSFSPWGFVAFAVLALVLKGPAWIRESLRVGRWKVWGIEYDGTEAASTFKKELNEAAEIVERANKEIGVAYKSAKSYASQLRDQHQIGVLTSRAAGAVAEIVGPSCPNDYRFTLYLPDFVFSDRLYQFTEYYDKYGAPLAGERAGRTYSVRYGIIGRVWRSGVAEVEGELISKEDQQLLSSDPSQGPIEKFIARRWGLSLEEAYHLKEYNSYGALRLDIAEKKVGLIFFYSKLINAFGNEFEREKALKGIEAMLQNCSLLPKLLEISHEVAPWSGRIQIFRNS